MSEMYDKKAHICGLFLYESNNKAKIRLIKINRSIAKLTLLNRMNYGKLNK